MAIGGERSVVSGHVQRTTNCYYRFFYFSAYHRKVVSTDKTNILIACIDSPGSLQAAISCTDLAIRATTPLFKVNNWTFCNYVQFVMFSSLKQLLFNPVTGVWNCLCYTPERSNKVVEALRKLETYSSGRITWYKHVNPVISLGIWYHLPTLLSSPQIPYYCTSIQFSVLKIHVVHNSRTGSNVARKYC